VPWKSEAPLTHICSHVGSISCGSTPTTVSGTLAAGDCILGDGSYLDLWQFTGQSGSSVIIDMRSSAFDTYLFLLDPSNNVVAQNDDGGDGTNSRIRFTLTSSGQWTIGANSFSAGGTGSYTLTLAGCGTTTCAPTPTSIACNSTRSGTLSTTDCWLADGSYYDIFTFSGAAGTPVRVQMRSAAFDSYLILVDPAGTIVAFDDDSLGGLDAEIRYILNSSGTWQIIANSFDPGETGNYTVSLLCETPISTCTYSVSPLTPSFQASGGNVTLTVSGSPTGCSGSWTALSNASWITVASGGSGSGSGSFTVGLSVAANQGAARVGTLTVAGQTVTVSQGAASTACSGTSACVLGGRFHVEVRYRNQFDDGSPNASAAVKPVVGFADPSYETAFFYFNNVNNIELMLKLLDQGNTDAQGRRTIAVLFGTATPLRVEVIITDTLHGTVRRYESRYNEMKGVTDFTAFVK
jgi:hypothetical protein